jgi:SAM-dependent methyltransferase
MSVARLDMIDTASAHACAAFLDLASSLPEVKKWKRYSLDLLAVREGDHALDIGCGTGDDAIALARDVGSTGRVVGVDLSETMVAMAAERAECHGLPVTFCCADIHDLPFENGSFQATRIDRVLHFLPDPALALEQAVRVTAPGGRIALTEPDWGHFTITGGNANISDRVASAAAQDARARIGRYLPYLLMAAGVDVYACRQSSLEIQDVATATTLFGLEGLALSVMGERETRDWFETLDRAAEQGMFRCRLDGMIVGGRVSGHRGRRSAIP